MLTTERHFFAPGRVNLIGDHTDYNGGLVFPAALNMGTYLTVKQNDDTEYCRFTSENNPTEFVIRKENLSQKQNNWVDYPSGVLKEFADRGYPVSGWQFHFRGDLPIGAALSSSASIEVVTAVALNALNDNPFTMLELVQMAQHAENDFVGMNCGIMDQFASGFGKKDCAIALDCNTLEYEHVPLEMRGLKFVIANSNKPRGLVDSEYNQRRAECQQALEIIQQHLPVDCLCQLSMDQFDTVAQYLDGNVLRRARHAVRENENVREAIAALKGGDMVRFGQLMNASHATLRDDYAVTCPETDFLATYAQQFPGVLGSRMTGAGFGGCTVTLIADDQVNAFVESLGRAYEERFGLRADFYVAEIGDGARGVNR
jgi:galactokinase